MIKPSQIILVLVKDLIFSSRISATARAQGMEVKMLRDVQALEGKAGRRLIVDLNQTGAIEAAIAWKADHGGEVVGFVAHVDSETIGRARAGELDRVLSRSQFVQILPELLA